MIRAPRPRSGLVVALLLVALGKPSVSHGQSVFLPEPATTALGIDTLAAGTASGSQRIAATYEALDAELTEALVTVYLVAVDGSGSARLTAVLDRFDGPPTSVLREIDLGSGLDGCRRVRWVVPLPEDLRELAIVLEAAGAWGAAPAVGGGEPPSDECPALHRGETSPTATPPIVDPTASPPEPPRTTSSAPSPPDIRLPSRDRPPPSSSNQASSSNQSVLRLLPVRGEVRGSTRFRTVATSGIIDRVEFHLDGEPVATSRRAPYSARIDLGPEVAPHRIRAVALLADGTPLGSDEILVNADRAQPEIRLQRVEPLDEMTTQVEAVVQVPPERTLDRVEMYWNETLVATLEDPPFDAPLDTPPTGTGTDFVRVVAHYDDGSWVEDVRLVGAGASGEEISVNLVELYVVLTNRDGEPVRDLTAEDLTVRGGGTTYPIERFTRADDLTLNLGLIVDTSESMWTLMPDTKRAASMFLSRILGEGDRAFLVDFDNQPRLARSSTDDIVGLIRTLGGLVADGATAMFDAIAFSSLQFEDSVGRRALVLLTDGDDYRSKLGLNKAIEQARQAGTPVYVIGLGGLDGFRRDLKTIDVEAIAMRTGGRVFLVQSMDALGEAYRLIEEDLRSQFLVAFSTPESLTIDELQDLEVRTNRRGLDARVVISPLSQ